MKEILAQPNGDALTALIDEVIQPECSATMKAQNSKAQMQVLFCCCTRLIYRAQPLLQFVYAVKSGLNSLLDVARQTYGEAVDEIHAEVRAAC